MGIIGTVLLVFVAVIVMQIFDIKENVWHEEKRSKKDGENLTD